jgi:hypothetical protein
MLPVQQTQAPTTYLTPCPQRRQRQLWPTIIGSVSLVMACLDLLSVLLTLMVWGGAGVMMIIVFVPRLIAAAMLLGGGGLLIRRRPLGKVLLVVWAKISLAFLALGAAILAFGLGALADQNARGQVSLLEVILICVLLLAAAGAYPVFLLIWLNRARVERDMTRW